MSKDIDKPIESPSAAQAELELDRRLLEEINILLLEGSLFCFDPREAKRRAGNKLTLKEIRKKAPDQPIIIDIHPSYGQPSVLAYKVLQAIFQKITEEGIRLTDDGRAIYDEVASFSQRELARLVGRKGWGSTTSQQLLDAVMQLHRTGIVGTLYDKETKDWYSASFYLVDDAIFSGRGDTISACSVRLSSHVMKSLNKRHVATFNLTRLNGLEPIALAMYKRIFYHFANLYQPKMRRSDLKFTKDYADVCREWLGGLKQRQHKSVIVRDQLGPHLDALKERRLIQRWTLTKNAKGDGFNLSFMPGQAFFYDYQLYYVDSQQPRMRFQAIADDRVIRKPLELVREFHHLLGRTDRVKFEDHETYYASELLDRLSEVEVRDLIRYAVAAFPKTNFDVLHFGAIKGYVAKWEADKERAEHRRLRQERVKTCPYCNHLGMLELREQGTHRHFATECPHEPKHVEKLLVDKCAERL